MPPLINCNSSGYPPNPPINNSRGGSRSRNSSGPPLGLPTSYSRSSGRSGRSYSGGRGQVYLITIDITPPIPKRTRIIPSSETESIFITLILNKSETLNVGIKYLYF